MPLDFELAAGLAPNEAGIRLIPMTGGTVLGAFIAGQLVSRTGHYRIFPILGAAAMTILCGAIAALGLGRSWPLDTVLTAAARLLLRLSAPDRDRPGAERARSGGHRDRALHGHVLPADRRRLWGRPVDGATGRRAECRRPRAPGPRRAGPQSRHRASTPRSAGVRQSGALDRLAARGRARVFSHVFIYALRLFRR